MVDLVKMKAIAWDASTQGTKFDYIDIPAELADKCAEERNFMVEAAAEDGGGNPVAVASTTPVNISPADGQPFEIRPFTVEPIHVTHSTIDCVALAIRTPAGVIVHTGDFKIDSTPVDGRPYDLHTLARYGDHGVLALVADVARPPAFTAKEIATRRETLISSIRQEEDNPATMAGDAFMQALSRLRCVTLPQPC